MPARPLWTKGIVKPKRSAKRDPRVAHQMTTVLRFVLLAALLMLLAPGATAPGTYTVMSERLPVGR